MVVDAAHLRNLIEILVKLFHELARSHTHIQSSSSRILPFSRIPFRLHGKVHENIISLRHGLPGDLPGVWRERKYGKRDRNGQIEQVTGNAEIVSDIINDDSHSGLFNFLPRRRLHFLALQGFSGCFWINDDRRRNKGKTPRHTPATKNTEASMPFLDNLDPFVKMAKFL